ncbi:MAG: hypothetical protein ACI9XU_001455 [Arenicella sp.]
MIAQIKYLVFKGIAKKEQILFKSFLNLAKNELPYIVVILKSKQLNPDEPNIVIMDEAYVLKESEASMIGLPSIVVGEDRSKDQIGYLSRPVQWSEFKLAMTNLDSQVMAEGDRAERVLPEYAMPFVIQEEAGSVAEIEQSSAPKSEFSDDSGSEHGLDTMSADYHTSTNSEYIKVVDDVRYFNEDDAGLSDSHGAVVLVSDYESSSNSGFLVIETPSMDAWDFNEAEFNVSSVVEDEHSENSSEFSELTSDNQVLNERAGFEISSDDEYWTEDNEIIVDNESFLFIKPAREMVYSDIEPGRWPSTIQSKKMTKVPLLDDWHPGEGLKGYPLSSFIWANTMVGENKKLSNELDESTEYLLERWPHFTLLELDNVLLKLCTMLFVRPESLQSLAVKSGYGRSTIIGLMNASYKLGYLKLPDNIDVDKMAHASHDAGMLGKIKDVFT